MTNSSSQGQFLQIILAHLVKNIGYSSIKMSSLQILTEMTQQILLNLGEKYAKYEQVQNQIDQISN